MTAQSRQTKVLVALLVSIITGALILNALGYNPPSAGAFCLSRYYRLAPVEKSVVCEVAQYRGRWRRIEIYCSGSSAEQARGSGLAGIRPAESLSDAAAGLSSHCHFIIWNARRDGQIDATEHWKNQRSTSRQARDDVRPELGDALTIFICLVTDRQTDRPTDFQVKRAEALVEELCRRFNIWPESVRYPDVRP